MSQGLPLHVVVEEYQDSDGALIAALARQWIQRVAERSDKPPAFSEKNVIKGGVIRRHSAPERATPFSPSSHAQSVFIVTDLPSQTGHLMGQRVRLCRGELGWYQKDLARESGVSRRAIQRLEADGVVPRIGTATKLANALGVSVAWLERGEGAKHGDDRSEGDGR